MIISYTQRDFGNAEADEDWFERKIVVLQGKRETAFDHTQNMHWVDEQDGLVGPRTKQKGQMYRHFIPRHEIFNAINNRVFGLSRRETMRFLLQFTNYLNIPRDTKLGTIGKPLDYVVAYNTWLTWAVEAICDYPGNMFFGFGIDTNGEGIDIPCWPNNPKRAFRQLNRCIAHSLGLLAFLPNLEDWHHTQLNFYWSNHNPHHWNGGYLAVNDSWNVQIDFHEKPDEDLGGNHHFHSGQTPYGQHQGDTQQYFRADSAMDSEEDDEEWLPNGN